MATVRKSKKRFIVPICIVLALAIAGGGVAAAVKASRDESVELYTITSGSISENVSLTGDVTSGAVKDYKVGTVATVKDVYVEVGDEVKEGDLLATFDASSLDGQISSLQTSYNNSLNSYNATKENVENAKVMMNELDPQIEKLEDLVYELENGEPYVPSGTTKAPTSRSTTKRTTTESTTHTTGTRTQRSTTEHSTRAVPRTMTEALAQLTETLVQLTDSVTTLATMTEIIADTIADAAASGELNSEVIAHMVGDEIADAIVSGMIDSAELLVDSGTAVDMIEAAVAQVDFEALGYGFANSQNVALTSAQVQLAALEAERAVYKAQSNTTLLNSQKAALDTTKSALDTLKDTRAEMQAGWTAAFDGTITAVDITPNSQTSAISSGITLENLNSMTATVSLSEYDVHKVRKGMSAKITTAYGQYDGEVLSIAPTATGGNQSSILDNVGGAVGISGLSSLTAQGAGVECKVAIFNTDANIIPGFDADVEINTGSFDGVPTVPIESIVLEKEGTFVYLYDEEEGTATKTQIETGAISDTEYEIKSGLKVGDRIIAIPSSDYKEDTFKIKVK